MQFLTVNYLIGHPHVRPMPEISAVAGETLYVACPVAGYPIDNVKWYRGKSHKHLFSAWLYFCWVQLHHVPYKSVSFYVFHTFMMIYEQEKSNQISRTLGF